MEGGARRAPSCGFAGAVVSERFDGLGADGAPARLGIMGGTFDPVHLGHLVCAEMARDAFQLDGVVFMVAARPSLKQQRAVSGVDARLDMCRLAIADNPAFDASALEAQRPGITYTADTLRALRTHYPANVELSFIIGADSLETLPSWHDAAAVAALARFLCVARPGTPDAEARARAARADGFAVDLLDAPLLDISSSEIRRRVRAGQSIRYLAPLAVCDYIAARGLYAERERRC